MQHENIAGTLYGMAFGDALAAPTEFMDMARILELFPQGPRQLMGHPARVTDDTQMALAVGEALAASPQPYEPDSLSQTIVEHFVTWSRSPDNNRAPGLTCMRACGFLANGMSWLDSTVVASKGCGANMRVMPVGLLSVKQKTRAAIAQLQAAITHGHRTALAAADLTAFIIAELGNGTTPDDILAHALAYAESQRNVYHTPWLHDLWTQFVMANTPQDFISHGWDECIGTLQRISLRPLRWEDDPCAVTGAGWIAEEAMATALLCFLLYPDDPVMTIRRAAVTSGDSDSIACIAGAFAGAYHGIDAWHADWRWQIEYQDRIDTLIEFFDPNH